MDKVISVIVPVYKVEKYLPQCLDSILNQDYEHLEVILIDDGSPDNCGAICDEYARKDSRIRVIHQKNAGAAAAKNAGLRIATGEYLSFADSDDYLEPGAYRYMMSALMEAGADAGEFSFRYLYRSRTEDHIIHPQRVLVDGSNYLRRFTQGWSSALLWNKLYKRSLFDGIFFEEGHRIDDEYFTYQGMMNARQVVCDPAVVYNYRMRASGAMGNPKAGEQRMLDRVDYLSKRRIRVGERFPELKRDFDLEYLDALTYLTDYPENTEKSLTAIRKAMTAYFSASGNTFPPKHLWKGILRVICTPASKLLEACTRETEPNDQSDYFA